MNNPNTYV